MLLLAFDMQSIGQPLRTSVKASDSSSFLMAQRNYVLEINILRKISGEEEKHTNIIFNLQKLES